MTPYLVITTAVIGVLLSMERTAANPGGTAPTSISNVNFGTFLIPEDELVNSGSTWVHTFQIEGITLDPIPGEMKKNITWVYEGCRDMALTAIGIRESSQHTSTSETQAEHAITHLCEKALQISETFNSQRTMLIRAIEEDVMSIRQILQHNTVKNSKKDQGTEKRAIEFISQLGEDLFGIGRKKSIDIAHRNHEALKVQVNNSFGRIAGNFKELWSVNKLQNQALAEARVQLS